jgi:hypothetical protein
MVVFPTYVNVYQRVHIFTVVDFIWIKIPIVQHGDVTDPTPTLTTEWRVE